MKIKIPTSFRPTTKGSLLGIDLYEYLRDFANYFKDEDFDQRYFSQFDWFMPHIENVDTFANLGCGRGRETFALLWCIGALSAIGLDSNNAKINQAIIIADFRKKFHDEILPSIYSQHDKNILLQWYESLPDAIIDSPIPVFDVQDLTNKFSSFAPSYNLVYFRYLLWIIDRNTGGNISSLCENVLNLLDSDNGLLIFVEPSKRGSISYDFVSPFERLGLTLVRIEENNEALGWLESVRSESDPSDPKGYIFVKSNTR